MSEIESLKIACQNSAGCVMDLINLTFSEKVETFLSNVFGGRHRVAKIIEHPTFCEVIPHGSLSTFDDDKLTLIVIESHDLGLRAEVTNHGMRGVKIMLHNRKSREGRLYARHPTLAEATVKHACITKTK
jgi:hypothetical protein